MALGKERGAEAQQQQRQRQHRVADNGGGGASAKEDKNMPAKIYIGGLGNSGDEESIEAAFRPYGLIRTLFVARRPPGFAFVEYERLKDARAAVDALTGKLLCGRDVRIELSHGRSRWPAGRPPEYLLRMPAPRRVRSPPPTKSPGSANDEHKPAVRRSRRRRRSRSSCSSSSTSARSASSSSSSSDASNAKGKRSVRS